MELEFKPLSMMKLRSSPGEILDRVHKQGEAFIIERSGQPKACLVPISHFFPDIPNSKVNQELDDLQLAGEHPTQSFSDKREREILFKDSMEKNEVTIKIVLPHRYPNVAPKIYASPIRTDAPHRWKDGALCIFGAMENWNPGKHNLASTLNLTRKWLSHYEIWDDTGNWPTKEEGKL